MQTHVIAILTALSVVPLVAFQPAARALPAQLAVLRALVPLLVLNASMGII